MTVIDTALRRARWVLRPCLALALGIGLIACGGGNTPDADGPPPPCRPGRQNP